MADHRDRLALVEDLRVVVAASRLVRPSGGQGKSGTLRRYNVFVSQNASSLLTHASYRWSIHRRRNPLRHRGSSSNHLERSNGFRAGVMPAIWPGYYTESAGVIQLPLRGVPGREKDRGGGRA